MKRLLMLTVLSLSVALLVTSPSLGAGTTTSSTSSKVTPKRDKTRPYKFKTTGTVRFPTSFCAPNQPRTNCIPLRCPAGTNNANYCARPTLAQICTGTVRIIFKAGLRTRSSKLVSIKSNCTFSSTVTIRQRSRLRISARFAGNTILNASRASTKSARSG